MLFLGWGLGRGEKKRANTDLQIANVPSSFSHWTSSGNICCQKNHRIGSSQVCSHLPSSLHLWLHTSRNGKLAPYQDSVLCCQTVLAMRLRFLPLNWNLPWGVLLPPLIHMSLAPLGSRNTLHLLPYSFIYSCIHSINVFQGKSLISL